LPYPTVACGYEKRVVFPGRFQPVHKGHVHALGWLSGRFDEIIVVVGSAQKSHSVDNPFTAGERILMLREALREGGVDLSKFIFVPVPDIEYNSLWVRYVETLVPPFMYAASRNPLVKTLFEESGYKVVEPPVINRREYSGRFIRSLMLKGDESWRELVPSSVARIIDEVGGVARLRTVSGTDEEVS
jgi:nicotinamide-nucleotide adenylyltransferase